MRSVFMAPNDRVIMALQCGTMPIFLIEAFIFLTKF